MTIGELKKILNKYSNDMEVLIEGALGGGFSIEKVNYGLERDDETRGVSVCLSLYSSYLVNALEDALGEDL